MPLPGRPRDAGGLEIRFRGSGQSGVATTRRWVSGPRNRFHARAHQFVIQAGRTPGVQHIELSLDLTAPGQIRRLWRQAVNYVPAGPIVSWSKNDAAGDPTTPGDITTALRYKASTVFRGSGSMSTRFGAPRTVVTPSNKEGRVTQSAGNLAARPTLRNRLSSFGSRVPPVNKGSSGV